MSNWFRLVNEDDELLGQVLLPDGILSEGRNPIYTCSISENLLASDWSRAISGPVKIKRVTFYRLRDTCRLVEGDLTDLEQMPQVRFFPSYGLITGKVKYS